MIMRERREGNADFLVATKPITMLVLLFGWIMVLYPRNQRYEDEVMETLITMLLHPMLLIFPTVAFIVIAFVTPWPNLRETIAGFATTILCGAAYILSFGFAPGFPVLAIIVISITILTPKLYNKILRCLPYKGNEVSRSGG